MTSSPVPQKLCNKTDFEFNLCALESCIWFINVPATHSDYNTIIMSLGSDLNNKIADTNGSCLVFFGFVFLNLDELSHVNCT